MEALKHYQALRGKTDVPVREFWSVLRNLQAARQLDETDVETQQALATMQELLLGERCATHEKFCLLLMAEGRVCTVTNQELTAAFPPPGHSAQKIPQQLLTVREKIAIIVNIRNGIDEIQPDPESSENPA